MKQKKKIILIGLPSSGKTQIGTTLAQILSYEFYDTDSLIIEKCNEKENRVYTTIQEVFSFLGEKNFRDLEKLTIKDFFESKNNINAVISTGGGVIIDKDNRTILKDKGIIIFINTPINIIKSRIQSQPERPLIGKNISSRLDQLDSERKPIMESLAHVIIDGSGSVEDICSEIISQLDLNSSKLY